MNARPAVLTLAVLTLAASAQAQIGNQNHAVGATGDWPTQENYHLRLEYREFRPKLEGTMRLDGELPGADVGLFEDLEMPDESTFDAHAALQFRPGRKLRGSYVKIDNKGDVPSLGRTFTYGDLRYVRTSAVASSMKGGYYAADLEWDLMHSSRGYVGALLGGRMLDADVVLTSLSLGIQNQDTFRSPIPVVGGIGRFYVGRVSVEAEAAGMSLGERGKVFDAAGSVRVHVSDRLAAQAGYRALSHTGKDGSLHIHFKNQGWQFGLELSL
jgi:hypothetical protein